MPVLQPPDQIVARIEADELDLAGQSLTGLVLQGVEHSRGGRFVRAKDAVDLVAEIDEEVFAELARIRSPSARRACRTRAIRCPLTLASSSRNPCSRSSVLFELIAYRIKMTRPLPPSSSTMIFAGMLTGAIIVGGHEAGHARHVVQPRIEDDHRYVVLDHLIDRLAQGVSVKRGEADPVATIGQTFSTIWIWPAVSPSPFGPLKVISTLFSAAALRPRPRPISRIHGWFPWGSRRCETSCRRRSSSRSRRTARLDRIGRGFRAAADARQNEDRNPCHRLNIAIVSRKGFARSPATVTSSQSSAPAGGAPARRRSCRRRRGRCGPGSRALARRSCRGRGCRIAGP